MAICALDPRALGDYFALLRRESRARPFEDVTTETARPSVVAIVLSWKRERNLPRVVRGLRRQSFVDTVVVVHNQPSRMRVPDCINLYCGANLGCGIRHLVAHDLVGWDAYLFIDDDLALEEDVASVLIPAFRSRGQESAIGFFGQVLNTEAPHRAYSTGYGGRCGTLLPVDVVKGRFHVLSRQSVERLNAGSKSTPALEEEDDIRVSLALQKATGQPSYLVPAPSMSELAEPKARWRRSGHLDVRDRAVSDAKVMGWRPVAPGVALERSLTRRHQWPHAVFGLRSCAAERDPRMSARFERSTREMDLRNLFNPSFFVDEEVEVFGFRAIPREQDAGVLCSFLRIEDASGVVVRNLSDELLGQVDGPRIIDPKVFRLEDGIYVTFNTGWDPPCNQIYVMKVFPEAQPPRRVHYRGRRPQERNWAFFEEDGEIYALYGIEPLVILRLVDREAPDWEFVEHHRGDGQGALTIGTPLARIDHRYAFVAHRKLRVPRRKLYLGRLLLFDPHEKRVEPRGRWLIHSLGSLLGSRTRHNTNLFSCTYFSGIQVVPGGVRLGYGINDVDWGFSVLPLDSR